MSNKRILGIAMIMSTLIATPLAAQTASDRTDPMIVAARDAANYLRDMLTAAAEQMTEEDYAFRPTPDVRTFGQLMAHVADYNYSICAVVRGDAPPARNLETTATTRADIRRVLAESFAYCDGAYAALTDAGTMITLRGEPRPALAALFFRTHHAALHYGNAVTYMRLRGKVPPSSQ